MPLNVKNINNFTQWKNGSVDAGPRFRPISRESHLILAR